MLTFPAYCNLSSLLINRRKMMFRRFLSTAPTMANLKLYTAPTPNGYKPSMFLELLGLEYDVKPIDIMSGEQKQPWFLELNPNGRIPTLVDNSTGITISETAAILSYLADTYDKERKFSYKPGTKEYYRELELTYFQMAGLGPMQGQANHFVLFVKEDIPYAKERYLNETKRLYGVLEEQLKRNDGKYLVGDHISIADIANVSWAFFLPGLEIPLSEFPRVHQWVKDIYAIPAVKKGLSVPTKSKFLPEEF